MTAEKTEDYPPVRKWNPELVIAAVVVVVVIAVDGNALASYRNQLRVLSHEFLRNPVAKPHMHYTFCILPTLTSYERCSDF